MPQADPGPLKGAYGLRPVDRRRLVRGVADVMRCGPRVVAELLLELDNADEVLRRLDNFRRLSPEVADVLEARQWTRPLREACR
jgi:hypothetical protein